MSVLLDKQVNAQKEKNFWGSHKLPQAHEKVCNEMKQKNKINDMSVKMLFKEQHFIALIQNTGKNDLHELQGNDYGYNEGTICLVNG